VAPVDDVLARIRADGAFRTQLDRDPQSALAEYDLTTADLRVLADELADGDGTRTSGGSALRDLLLRDPADSE
jgi:hypothetical protein